jgi:adenylosuccinate synthase
MASQKMQRAALVARDAHLALLDLKRLVDRATEKIRAAELGTVGLGIGRSQGDDPLATLRIAAETLRSPDFEAAISQARAKTDTAVASYLTAKDQ